MLPIRLWNAFALIGCALAQTSRNHVQLFIHNMDPAAAWAASIQNACNGSTTYVVSCTSAPLNNCSPQTATITEGPDFYIATTAAIYSETSATMTESCALNSAATSASCVATIALNGFGQANAKTISYNLTGTDYYQYAVQVTKGASRTAGEGSCLAQVSRASGSSMDGGSRSVLVLGVGLMLGVVGVLAL
ncbi:uncharacterized protein RCC_06232 [Ramularia collo-cygni]|uniref:GPI anchored protein n=1 Tax=Ramularia collo-cygni TaxID=112498 RepID=A0A2D3USN8_9PEZI|nr:uncharacterized protein RCC_06232 [Ramularia collo-cygni]CZT20372.1 uncharacterized protein RCC_06232 [Ramularia collo-cygni]